MKVALDAMGAEKGIGTVIDASFAALKENPDIQIILIGKSEEIQKEIKKRSIKKIPFSIFPAPEVVSMDDSALAPLKEKRNSSISVGVELVKKGKADAFVSAGNTGAVMATSLIKLGKLEGVVRPCLAATFPTIDGKKVVITDVGANVDCKPVHLFQFALLGNIYAHKVLKIKNPKVALLNIGSEENKGNEVVVEAFKILKKSPLNFIGNIEGKDVTSGKAEVVVCDGFVGNILLKFAEEFAATTISLLDKEIKKNSSGVGHFVAGDLFRKIRETLDYAEYGGVPLLGVNGVCVVAHGASCSKAIKNAIITSYNFHKLGINKLIENALKEIKKRQENEKQKS